MDFHFKVLTQEVSNLILMCHPSLRLLWKHICKRVQSNAEKNAVWRKNKSVVSEKKTTVISHEELILIYNCVETKQRNHARGNDPPDALFIFRPVFLSELCQDIRKEFIIYFAFYTRDISSDFRENDWHCFIPWLKFMDSGFFSCSSLGFCNCWSTESPQSTR